MRKRKAISDETREKYQQQAALKSDLKDEAAAFWHDKALKSGYKPDKTTIGKQLKQLLEDKEITQDNYDVGMRHLNGETRHWKGNLGDELRPGEEVEDGSDGEQTVQDD